MSCPKREVARWRKVAGEPLWEEWVKKMEGEGHKEARAVLNDTLEMLKKIAPVTARACTEQGRRS